MQSQVSDCRVTARCCVAILISRNVCVPSKYEYEQFQLRTRDAAAANCYRQSREILFYDTRYIRRHVHFAPLRQWRASVRCRRHIDIGLENTHTHRKQGRGGGREVGWCCRGLCWMWKCDDRNARMHIAPCSCVWNIYEWHTTARVTQLGKHTWIG